MWSKKEDPETTIIKIPQRDSHLKYFDIEPDMSSQIFEKCSIKLQPRWVNKLWQTERKPAIGIGQYIYVIFFY